MLFMIFRASFRVLPTLFQGKKCTHMTSSTSSARSSFLHVGYLPEMMMMMVMAGSREEIGNERSLTNILKGSSYADEGSAYIKLAQ
jgi:hypothetical protein